MDHHGADVVVGAAEQALRTRHRSIVDEVEDAVGRETPLAPSASAFRVTSDPELGDDVLNTSAVAAELGVLLRAVEEQPLSVPLLDKSNTGPGSTAVGGEPPTPAAVDRAPTPAAAVHEAVGTLTAVLTRAEALMAVPSQAVGRERGQLACRAYAQGWYDEAERMFLEAAERLPTEPYLWFGAGMSALNASVARAVGHLRRSARYLLATDPPAAAYVHIVAAAVHERDDDRAGAAALLASALDQLGAPCPAISLHLARLRPGDGVHLRRALEVDPLLEADVIALQPVGASVALAERRRQSADELGSIEYSMAELRRVDDAPAWRDPPSGGDQRFRPDGLPLTRLEVELWTKLRRCEQEIDQARQAVTARQEARQAKEREISEATELTRGDLGYRTAVPMLLAGVAVALGLLSSFWLRGLIDIVVPLPALAVTVWVAVGRVGLVGFYLWLLIDQAWPRRHFHRARRAEQRLPELESQATQLRHSEFEARRRFSQAHQVAELRLRRVVNRRRQVVPRRPRFSIGGPPEPTTANSP